MARRAEGARAGRLPPRERVGAPLLTPAGELRVGDRVLVTWDGELAPPYPSLLSVLLSPSS
eukprot:COSAG01_NODE_7647_length_3115_cov_1.557692_5_plen_61_part_00